MRKSFFVLFFLALFCWNMNLNASAHDDDEFFKPVEIKDGSSLSMMDCVASAFKNSPKIKRQKYNLDIAKSNLGIARSAYFPVISAGVGFHNENNSDNVYYNHYYRELPNVGVSVNKMIWDFGKTTSYIKMEEFYKIGAEYEFMDSLCSTLFDIKAKYYNMLRAGALMQIAQNNVEINKDFVKNAKAGADLTTAKLNLSEAEVAYLEAKNNFYNAKVDLTNSMYLDNQPDFSIKNTKTFDFQNDYAYTSNPHMPEAYLKYDFPFKRENAPELAYESSPDLRVLTSTRDAMIQSLKYIKKTYLPTLSGNVGYGFNNTNETSNNSLQVGVNLSSNVNLMELRHSIKGADAQVYLADNEIVLFKKDLYYEVKRAFNNFDKAENQIPTSQLEAKQALENLKLVDAKYKSGELNYIALQDARKDYIMAVNHYVETIYNYNMALIQIEMAMHHHIVDIHHKSEHAMCYHSEALINHLNEVLGCDEHEEHMPKRIKKIKKQKDDL